MTDQATRLRQLAAAGGRYPAAAGSLPLVVVAGGHAGVGASTVAHCLAQGLHEAGQRTLLVELDGATNSLDEFASEPEGAIADCLAGRQRVIDSLQLEPSGLWVLPGDGSAATADCTARSQQQFLRQLQDLQARIDVVVLDVGSQRNLFVRRLWQSASMVVLVSRDDPQSIKESYVAIKQLLAGETALGVYTCVNAAGDHQRADVAHDRLHATCRKFLGLRTSPLGNLPLLAEAANALGTDRLAEQVIAELGLLATSFRIRPAAHLAKAA